MMRAFRLDTGGRRAVAVASAIAVTFVALAFPGESAADGSAHDGLVERVPVEWTPRVLDGDVYTIAEAGNLALIGGDFTSYHAYNTSSETTDRPHLFAVNKGTGAIDANFTPVVDGPIQGIAVAPDGNSVIIGGDFRNIDGVAVRNLAKLDVATGQLDPEFNAHAQGSVLDVVWHQDRLFVGGAFRAINGVARTNLAELDPATGQLLDDVDFAFDGEVVNRRGSGRRSVSDMAITPDGSTLVTIGNFGSVDGQQREQVAMFDLLSRPAQLQDWHTRGFRQLTDQSQNQGSNVQNWCSSSFAAYVRGVSFAPDGSYFVVVTTGAARYPHLCDTATRWETSERGQDLDPTWIDYSGGDTYVSSGITDSAIYVGGHHRWSNNPYGRDFAGAGAVPREGLTAMDPRNGLPLSWDPGRARGYGVHTMVPTSEGLWIGHDTNRVANRQRPRATFFETSGTAIGPASMGPLPGTLYSAAVDQGNVLTQAVEVTDVTDPGLTMGATTPVAGGGVDFNEVGGAFLLSGTLYVGTSSNEMVAHPYEAGTFGAGEPLELYGLAPTRFRVADITGMTYDEVGGDLYYTLAGRNALFTRPFTAESQVVGSEESVVTQGSGAGVNWQQVRGLHLDRERGQLYLGSTSGQLRRIDVDPGGVPVPGTLQTVSGPGIDGRTWDRPALFASASAMYESPNLAPQATLRAECDQLDCRFASAGSFDPDGVIQNFAWESSDGASGVGPGFRHQFASQGSYDVSLTVTDADGATDTETLEILVGHPDAAMNISCDALACVFDGSPTQHPDANGQLSFEWSVEGSTLSGEQVAYTFATAGTHEVTLRVTDAFNLSDEIVENVTVASARDEVTLVGVDGTNDHDSSFQVTVPEDVRPGDRLLLWTSVSVADAVVEVPEGFAEVETVVAGNLQSTLWEKVSDVGDEPAVLVTTDGRLKADVSLFVYSGVAADAPLTAAVAPAPSSTDAHISPGLSAAEGAGVVSYWTDRSSGTEWWQLPAPFTEIYESFGSGGGRISAMATHEITSAAGTYGGHTATASDASRGAAGWTVVLPPR